MIERHVSHTTPLWVTILIGALIALLIAAGAAGYYYHTDVTERLTNANATIAAQSDELAAASSTIAELNSTLDKARDALANLEEAYDEERERNEDFEDRIDDLSDTLDTLDKLAKLDEELLMKYSRVYFLNENYTPTELREIDRDFVAEGKVPQYFLQDALPFLEDLIEDAERDDIDLRVASAYRTFDHQNALNETFVRTFGEGANAFSATQGYSEHQLGTTVDFSTPELGGAIDPFGTTEAYQWMLDNAYKHGFILSYPEDNGFYIFEPWHWRFVGEDLARELHRRDMNFYDMEQREIDEYLLNIFE